VRQLKQTLYIMLSLFNIPSLIEYQLSKKLEAAVLVPSCLFYNVLRSSFYNR